MLPGPARNPAWCQTAMVWVQKIVTKTPGPAIALDVPGAKRSGRLGLKPQRCSEMKAPEAGRLAGSCPKLLQWVTSWS